MKELNKTISKSVEYLDMTHRYYIVIALKKELEDHLYDCTFIDKYGEIIEGFEGMWFDEKAYILMEKYLFNFIDAECDLLINMYEEEYADLEKLPQILDIIGRMIDNSDNEEFIRLANEFKALVKKALDLGTFVGFCF